MFATATGAPRQLHQWVSESKYATPRQRSQASAFEFTSAFQSCLPESASKAKMLLCGVHKKTLLPTCSGVIWSSAPLPVPVVKSPVRKRHALMIHYLG